MNKDSFNNILVGGILIVVIFLILTIFSGCTEQEAYGDIDKVELLNYSIETQKYDNGYKTIGNGFIHNSDAKLYLITGTIKNIAGEMIDSIKITGKFYDNTNNFLREENTYTGSIANAYTEDFRLRYYDNEKYFENVCSVKFEFEVTN